MKTLLETQDDTHVKLTIEIDEAEFEPAINAAFKEIAKDIRIPGFRPGKAPRKLIERQIGGEYARGQALENGLSEYYVNAVVEHDLDVVAAPTISIKSGQESGPIEFEAIVEVRPVVDATGYDKIQVTLDRELANETHVDDILLRFRQAFVTFETVDRAATLEDAVVVDISGSIDGEPVPTLQGKDTSIPLGQKLVVKEFDENLVGAKAGDKVSFDGTIPGLEDFENDEDDDEPAPVLHFDVEVKLVQAMVLPEADDAFATSVSEFSTIGELRADLLIRAQTDLDQKVALQFREKVSEALVGLVDIELSPALVEEQMGSAWDGFMHVLQNQGITVDQYLERSGTEPEELMESVRGSASMIAKSNLVMRHVIKVENVEVSEAELNDHIAFLAEDANIKPAKARANLEKSLQLRPLKINMAKEQALAICFDKATAVDQDGNAIDLDPIRAILNGAQSEHVHDESCGIED